MRIILTVVLLAVLGYLGLHPFVHLMGLGFHALHTAGAHLVAQITDNRPTGCIPGNEARLDLIAQDKVHPGTLAAFDAATCGIK